jgi:hypothetical protein
MAVMRIGAGTIALLVAGLLWLVVGTGTDNGGLQLGGGMLLVVGVLNAIRELARRG